MHINSFDLLLHFSSLVILLGCVTWNHLLVAMQLSMF